MTAPYEISLLYYRARPPWALPLPEKNPVPAAPKYNPPSPPPTRSEDFQIPWLPMNSRILGLNIVMIYSSLNGGIYRYTRVVNKKIVGTT